jgi:hypothetical protein
VSFDFNLSKFCSISARANARHPQFRGGRFGRKFVLSIGGVRKNFGSRKFDLLILICLEVEFLLPQVSRVEPGTTTWYQGFDHTSTSRDYSAWEGHKERWARWSLTLEGGGTLLIHGSCPLSLLSFLVISFIFRR